MHSGLQQLFQVLQPSKAAISTNLPAVPSAADDYPLGYEFPSYTPHTGTVDVEQDSSPCYRVRQGRVRIFCYSSKRNRLVSAMVLEAGEVFGADHLFCEHPLAYRAIAASPCQVMAIPPSRRQLLTAPNSPFYSALQDLAQRRSQLIFFKQFTDLYALPSSCLQHELLPRITAQHLRAGDRLRPTAGAENSWFWLRSGQLWREPGRVAIGSAWSSQDLMAGSWIAQSPVVIYQLLLTPWETADFLATA